MSTFSVADEIKKYKDLLDSGAITQEEFDSKKEELLKNPPVYTNNSGSNGAAMSRQTTNIVAYLTWIGFILALCLGDREQSKFHINQALVINLFALLSVIPVVGWIWGIVMIIFWIMAFISACSDEEKEVPLIGGIRIIQ